MTKNGIRVRVKEWNPKFKGPEFDDIENVLGYLTNKQLDNLRKVVADEEYVRRHKE